MVRKFYVLYYWVPQKPRYKLLGPVGHPAWTLEQAQDEVRTLRRLVRQAKLRGEPDPLGKVPKEPKRAMSLDDATKIYQRRVTKSDKVRREDAGRWANHISPFHLSNGKRLGSLPLHTVTVDHLWQLREAMSNKRVAFNRVLALLSNFFNQVDSWNLIPNELAREVNWRNPATSVDKYPEQRRERIYKPREVAAMSRAAESLLLPSISEWQRKKWRLPLLRARSLLALRIIMRTGHRPDEIRRLEWEQIYWERSFADLPHQKGDRKIRKGRILAFGPKSIADLQTLKQLSEGSDFCFASRYNLEAHVGESGLRKAWKSIKEQADTEPGMRLTKDKSSDLYAFRHTVINLHSEAGIDYADMVDYVGHSKQGTTHRYRHSDGPRLAIVAQKIENHLATWVGD